MSTRTSDPATVLDPDRNGHHDPGTTPDDHRAVLAREVDAFHQHRRQG
ncbi:hypothetical protein [Nesterenkonia sp. HG001]|nr:hypothetical protein [Nesterenkonia sp. HG001]MDZ5076760.1 hypothetical protein [Nesterenkonia sp. HG001]